MDEIELGHKRICPLCSAKYYDFFQDELDCPSCGKPILAVNINKPKRGRKSSSAPNAQDSKDVGDNDDLKDLIDENDSSPDPLVEEDDISEDISLDISDARSKEQTEDNS